MTSASEAGYGDLSVRYKVIRRNGSVVPFNAEKIKVALSKAFIATEGQDVMKSSSRREILDRCVSEVIGSLDRYSRPSATFRIEEIQDQVERVLMRGEFHQVARNYVLYREKRNEERRTKVRSLSNRDFRVARADGILAPLDAEHLHRKVDLACQGLSDVDADAIVARVFSEIYDGITEAELNNALILAARMMIEREPNYSFVSARLLLDKLRGEVLGHEMLHGYMEEEYPQHLREMLDMGVSAGLINPQLKVAFDLKRLGSALRSSRDLNFGYLGLQTLYDRYFLHVNGRRIEMPQTFFMRVAMGLALREDDPTMRAIEFYNLLSKFDFMSSTPTLFNSGTTHSQLSSCYLSTVGDDLNQIFDSVRDNALLAKYAGGLGNDWTRVRAMGSHIRGTNGRSQGVIPFLKVVNDTAVAVNQCFAPETQVYVADGARRIADVHPGDLVLGHSGCYREVLEHFAYAQKDPMVAVSSTHALDPLMVTSGHPLMALQASGSGLDTEGEKRRVELDADMVRWTEAGALQAGDYVVQTIPQEVVNLAGIDELDARMMGIAIARGQRSGGDRFQLDLSVAAPETASFVKGYLRSRGVCYEGEEGESLSFSLSYAKYAGAGAHPTPTSGAPVPLPVVAAFGADRIPREASHLPLALALPLAEGAISAVAVSGRDSVVLPRFLAEDVRYQLLRLGVPCAGRHVSPSASELDATVDETRRLMGLASGDSWFRHGARLFSRVERVEPMEPLMEVHDLRVEGDESYMTGAALAHNGGKRKGAVCCYLETWHLDIEEFLELRKNSGDERRRTHDMNTANWIPDLFMKRVEADGEWTLFSPNEVPDLHEKFGREFEKAYLGYEQMAAEGRLNSSRKVGAVNLWRKMLTMLYETGHPWVVFKDACNLRSPQQHCGVVHSSNLCTEITLNTSDDEVAVCNLGSVNLLRHIKGGKLDGDKIARTVRTAIRMLDNVIDINHYAVDKAKRSNLRHRPIGLGIMGYQDCLYELGISYASDEAVEFADRSMELIAYHAYSTSADLALERGAYDTFAGSFWDRGILPIDSIDLLEEERGEKVTVARTATLDWEALRAKIQKQGMRNSNCLAIAPTATIANIVGVTSSIEPTYQNMYVKSNLSGDFTVCNFKMVEEFKRLGIWDETMVSDIKYYDGLLRPIDRVPEEVKNRYPTAHEINPLWLVKAAARRQKWIDQAQSLNLYFAEPNGERISGKLLDETYRSAWRHGLKTTYYLRSLGANATEKYTTKTGAHNAVPGATNGELGAKGGNGSRPDCDGDICEVCQ